MSYLGDWDVGSIHDFKFSSRNSAGMQTLSGTPALSVYKTNSTTQTTTGVTLSVDFDGVTGFNHVRIDTSSDGTFYAAGCDFDVVITTGTVGGVSVVGEVVGSFSIKNRIVINSTGTAQAGTASTITLASGAVATDDYYNFQWCWIVRGTGVGQRRLVINYVGSTKVATVHRSWATNPDSTSEYIFEAGYDFLGTVGTVNDASASTTGFITSLTGYGDDFFKGSFLCFIDGTMRGQSRKISGYTSATGAVTFSIATIGTVANSVPFTILGRSE